jgi:hypothetical protein
MSGMDELIRQQARRGIRAPYRTGVPPAADDLPDAVDFDGGARRSVPVEADRGAVDQLIRQAAQDRTHLTITTQSS